MPAKTLRSQMMSFSSRIIFAILLVFATTWSATAATIQLPEWYRLEIVLDSTLKINTDVTASVRISSLIGDLQDTRIRLICPENWIVDSEEKFVKEIKAGDKASVAFKVRPTSYLAQGSIIAEAVLNVPFTALEQQIRQTHPDQAAAMIKTLHNWPRVTKRYSEISFALLEQESLCPLDKAIWLNYHQQLAPGNKFKGPVFYDDPVITTYQAQTDVEMFEKLQNYIKADPGLKKNLVESGIDLQKKKFDQLNGLYVLAARSFLDKNYEQARNFIDRFETEARNFNSELVENLEIAALNLKGLVFWSMDQKRLAEDYLKKAFYSNRKNPLQRYVLRNIALLMLANKERATAEHMMRLALGFKSGYTLLENEYEEVRNP
jgi:tetratricopeptide (TPR) repeat protein